MESNDTSSVCGIYCSVIDRQEGSSEIRLKWDEIDVSGSANGWSIAGQESESEWQGKLSTSIYPLVTDVVQHVAQKPQHVFMMWWRWTTAQDSVNKVSPTHRGQGNDGEGEPDLTEEQSLVSDGTEDGIIKKIFNKSKEKNFNK